MKAKKNGGKPSNKLGWHQSGQSPRKAMQGTPMTDLSSSGAYLDPHFLSNSITVNIISSIIFSEHLPGPSIITARIFNERGLCHYQLLLYPDEAKDSMVGQESGWEDPGKRSDAFCPDHQRQKVLRNQFYVCTPSPDPSQVKSSISFNVRIRPWTGWASREETSADEAVIGAGCRGPCSTVCVCVCVCVCVSVSVCVQVGGTPSKSAG